MENSKFETNEVQDEDLEVDTIKLNIIDRHIIIVMDKFIASTPSYEEFKNNNFKKSPYRFLKKNYYIS